MSRSAAHPHAASADGGLGAVARVAGLRVEDRWDADGRHFAERR